MGASGLQNRQLWTRLLAVRWPLLLIAFLWTLFLLNALFWTAIDLIFNDGELQVSDEIKNFWLTAIWFLLLIAVNYALLFNGGEPRP